MDNEMTNGEDKIAAEGLPVCLNCLRPYDNVLEYYCPHCGSNEAANPLTPYMAFVNIRFNVGMVRGPTERDDCKASPGFGDSVVVLPAVVFCDAFCGVCKVEESQAARCEAGALLHSDCGGACGLFFPDRKVGQYF